MEFQATNNATFYTSLIVSDIINLGLKCGTLLNMSAPISVHHIPSPKPKSRKRDTYTTRILRVKKKSLVRDVYIPLPRTLIKSPPTSAAFFSVYNTAKPLMERSAYTENINRSIGHIIAVYCGHTASCIIRVPVDITRQQARIDRNLSTFALLNKLVHTEGVYRRLFRQLSSTVIRELPFCSIKFPVWEFLKYTVESSHLHRDGSEIKAYESAICGSIAGGTAAALTMPIDLAHKRISIDKKSEQYKRWKLLLTIRDMAREEGIRGLYAGVRNRVPMISFGGFLFFMTYEQKRRFLFEEEDVHI